MTLKNMRATTLSYPEAENKNDPTNSTPRYYKKVLSEKPYFCPCSTCLSIGINLITQQYTNSKNILLEDHSKLIFNPLLQRSAPT